MLQSNADTNSQKVHGCRSEHEAEYYRVVPNDGRHSDAVNGLSTH